MKHTVAALLLLTLLTGTLTGCQKYTLDKTTTYTFSNGLNVPVTLNIYNTKADYNNAVNAWQQLTLPAYGRQILTMEIGKNYFVDWYSADGLYSNWLPANNGSSNVVVATPAPLLNAAAVPQTITLSQNYPNYDRYLLLPGNSKASTWQVIGTYNGTSQPDPAPYTLLTFNKDFTGSMTYALGNGDTTTIPSQFYNYNTGTQSNYLSLYMYSTVGGQSLAMCNYEPGYPYPQTSRDTLSCSLYYFNTSYTYIMVRK